MRDWGEYWNSMPRKWAGTDFMKQIEKTVKGRFLSEAH